jgi:hypothetical protein
MKHINETTQLELDSDNCAGMAHFHLGLCLNTQDPLEELSLSIQKKHADSLLISTAIFTLASQVARLVEVMKQKE